MLNGKQVEQVCAVLIDAFSLDDLRQLVRFELDQRLDVIVATDRPLNQVVFDLVDWADANDLLVRLLAAAAAQRPDHQRLAQLAGELAAQQPGTGAEASSQMQRVDVNQRLHVAAEPESAIETTLITWLINRAQQTYSLARLIQCTQDLRAPRPIICLLHGNDDECHDKFVERIVRYQLKSLIPAPQGSPQHFLLELPRKYNSSPELHDFLRAGLGHNAVGNMAAAIGDVNERFANLRAPVVIHTWMGVEGWGKGERRIVQDYLGFWNGWPDMAQAQWLLIFLCIRVQPKSGGWLSSLMSHKGDDGNLEAALAEFGTLEAGGRNAGLNRIICTPLPPLEPVGREDAEGWASDPKVQQVFARPRPGERGRSHL